MRSFALRSVAALAIAVALALGGDAPARAQSFNDAQRSEIERIMRDFLLKNPEILQDVMGELEKKQAVAEAQRHKQAIKQHADALFNSPLHATLGNPQGDVTFVEFFDYNCGYCKRALSDMMDLLKSDPKLKVVLKEFPVLGPGSVEAARVSQAARMQEVRTLGEITVEDGGSWKLAAPASWGAYLHAPAQLKRDLAQARWKPAFLQRLFGVPLPYGKVYAALKHKK